MITQIVYRVVSNISKISIKQQFTTLSTRNAQNFVLFRIFQRSQLNSNSQHWQQWFQTTQCCFEYFKDLN